METKALQNLQQVNDLTLSKVDANGGNLKSDIERGGQLLSGLFDQPTPPVSEGETAVAPPQNGEAIVDTFSLHLGTDARQSLQLVSAAEQVSTSSQSQSDSASSMAASAEEMSVSINQITQNADTARQISTRAGEQEPGFAVVADEVRKLAERTTTSTQSIVERIDSIQTGTKVAIHHIQDGVAQVEQGSVLAGDAGRAIEEIHRSSCEVIDAVASIANAINVQSQATQAIAQSAQALRDMATALDENLAFFRVD